MKHTTLDVTKREILGSRVKTLRREGILPAVIYSNTVTPIHIQLPTKEMIRVYKEAGTTNVIDITIDSKTLPCIIHDIDVHPVTSKLVHVDFLAVNLKVKVKTEVPLTFIHEAPGIKEFAAILNTPLLEVEVEALPDKIPSEIIVDISSLTNLDSLITVGDLPTTSDFKIISDSSLAVASLTAQQDEPEETGAPEDGIPVDGEEETPTEETE